MSNMVQKLIVHDPGEASPILPRSVALFNEDGTPFAGAPGATTAKAGVVKQADGVAAVSTEDAAQAVGKTPTKAEFDAVVMLANATKAAINDIVSNLKAAGIMD